MDTIQPASSPLPPVVPGGEGDKKKKLRTLLFLAGLLLLVFILGGFVLVSSKKTNEEPPTQLVLPAIPDGAERDPSSGPMKLDSDMEEIKRISGYFDQTGGTTTDLLIQVIDGKTVVTPVPVVIVPE